MTPYVLAAIFFICTIILILAAFKIQLSADANAPTEDKEYWKKMTSTFKKGFIVGAIGSGAAIIAILIKHAIFAEVCCFTLLSALIFPLAILSRKTAFRPNAATERTQKRWQFILLFGAVLTLFLTQFVFSYFNALITK